MKGPSCSQSLGQLTALVGVQPGPWPHGHLGVAADHVPPDGGKVRMVVETCSKAAGVGRQGYCGLVHRLSSNPHAQADLVLF